ncbi:extracellular solute-binding protein [Paenibacillus mesophilus]|uniref:ABC transporter substrate-binding protein n=1 Tax=Paenibacillus mesophilus TaxID=2582849 RepID=UPI00110E8EF3|nr:extracellular solute-binding protein [Paenibacillus mesophilus]TMV49592.1 extracellular solute-binding protein [Paenibacillus mesophilus]
MVTKKWWPAAAMLLTVCSLAACSGGEKKEEARPAENRPKEPVTLTIYDPNAKADPALFMENYGNAIQKKFPYITVKYISSPDTSPETHIENRIAAGEPIDIMFNVGSINHYRLISTFKLEYDMTGLIKSTGYDLSRLEPSAVKAVQDFSKGGMYAFPYRMVVSGMMYNKDLFDKFGKAYPKDNMTWDETYELAKTMTRVEGGTQYRGFITQFETASQNQLSVPFVDPKTDKALLNTDERWSRFVKNWTRFYEIPGNMSKENDFGSINNLFVKDKVAAMYAYNLPATQLDVNWDVVTLPEFSDRRGIGPQSLLTLVYVTSTSKHKEAAFDAISVLTSDEVQMHLAKKALAFPVINNQAVKDAYGQEATFLQGKNVRALLKNKPADPIPASPYHRYASAAFGKYMYHLSKGTVDVNTALRTMTEEADKEIEKAKAPAGK